MTGRPVPLARMPVLTEVVDLPLADLPSPGNDWQIIDSPVAAGSPPVAPPPAPPAAPPINEAQLTQRILGEVQRQVDLMVEFRLREALLPALARATDSLVKDARHELAATLKDVVTRAVSQELAKHRSR